jgi:branched-chain amino acid transport system permease protein
MTEYLVAGLVLGSVYSLVASILVVTYTSSGILNFAFGSMAYVIARVYYYLHSQHSWSTPTATLVCLVFAPLLGVFLWAIVFRTLQECTTLVKIVATIGLAVALPAIPAIAFGEDPSGIVPGLAPTPVPVYDVFGTAVTLNQVIVLACVAVIGLAWWWIMRFSDIGLVLRAMVSSRALTKVTGTNTAPYAVGVWAVTTFLAGLTGILVAPMTGVTSGAFTLLMASAFAAVIAARFRYVGRAIAAGLLLGIVGAVIQRYVPAESVWSAAATTSVPFAVIVAFLIYYIPRGQAAESGSIGSALDAAIALRSSDETRIRTLRGQERRRSSSTGSSYFWNRWAPGLNFVPMCLASVAIVIVATTLGSYWVGIVATGVTFAVAFLSYILITGEAGVISLCQITFAGIGAIATAEFATKAHLPVPVAIVLSGCIVMSVAGLLGYLTTRLGDLYIALVTLTFGILMDNLVFTLNVFTNFGTGIAIKKPHIFISPTDFLYVTFGVFVVLAGLIGLIRRATYGMSVIAVRTSDKGSRSIGINSAATKVVAMCIGGFIAGVGGSLMALNAGAALPGNFSTLFGFVWLAVVVTLGVRSVVGALIAGIASTVMPAVLVTYLSGRWNQVPTVLFGLGAVFIAKNPDGVVVMHVRQLGALVSRLGSSNTAGADHRGHTSRPETAGDGPDRTKELVVTATGYSK